MIAGTAQHCTLEMHELPNMLGCLNPEYPHGSIPNYQDFAIFGDIEEAAINNNEPIPEAATMPSGPDAAEATEAWKLPRSSSADPIPQWHAATGRYCLPGTLWITTMISPWR